MTPRSFGAGLLALLAPLAFAAAALLPAPAAAQPTVPDQKVCPVDGTRVPFQRVVSTNLLGGMDSDFCPYSSGVQPREFEVVTCPTCLYSARHARFSEPLDARARATVPAALKATLDAVPDPYDVPAWQRFEVAALTAAILGAEPDVVGHLYLEGAWTARDRVVGFLPRVSGPLEVWKTLDELEPVAAALTDRSRWALAQLDMHRAAHRGGFTARRDAYFQAVEQASGVPDAVRRRMDQVREWMAIEHRLLEKALGQFRIASARKGGEPARRARVEYLVGDLLRRLGRKDEGMPHVRAQAQNASAPEEVRAAAQQVVTAVGLGG